MSEDKNKCEDCDKCGEHCGHGFACNKSFFFIRWIFGLIILLIVFCVGIAIGKFAGQIESYDGYGSYGMMCGRGYSRMMQYDNYGYGPGMMRSWVIQTPDATAQVTAPSTKTK